MVDRILGLQEKQPLLSDPTLQWPVGARRDIKVNPVLVPAGYRVIRLGDRRLLHQVSQTNNCCLSFMSVSYFVFHPDAATAPAAARGRPPASDRRHRRLHPAPGPRRARRPEGGGGPRRQAGRPHGQHQRVQLPRGAPPTGNARLLRQVITSPSPHVITNPSSGSLAFWVSIFVRLLK